MGDGITVDATFRSGHETYINLTQPSIARQFRLKIVLPARPIGFRRNVGISHLEGDLGEEMTNDRVTQLPKDDLVQVPRPTAGNLVVESEVEPALN